MDTNRALDAVFDLQSVAIIGVSTGEDFNTGNLFLENILGYGFKGPIYPVNPRGGEIRGIKVHPRLADAPGPVDYVISCVRAPLVPQLVRECAAAGVKGLCVFTSGFSEMGTTQGRKLEEEVRQLARQAGLLLIGPNCLGIFSPKARFSYAPDYPREFGQVGFLCQSGGNTLYLVRAAAARGIRFSKAISYGNAAGVDESDLLEYFCQDPETRMIAAYIEGVKDGRRFQRVLRETARSKPVVILKGGRTGAGSVVAASHAAAMAGSGPVWRETVRQAGAIVVDTLDEMADMLITLSYLPPPGGKRVAMVGIGGGAGVLATDDWDDLGFILPRLPEDMRRAWRTALGNDAGTMLGNPLDVPRLGTGREPFPALARLHTWEAIDLLVFHMPFRGMMMAAPAASAIFDIEAGMAIKVRRAPGKPVAAVLHYQANTDGWNMAAAQTKKLYEAGIPVYYSIGGAARAIDRYLGFLARRTWPGRQGGKDTNRWQRPRGGSPRQPPAGRGSA